MGGGERERAGIYIRSGPLGARGVLGFGGLSLLKSPFLCFLWDVFMYLVDFVLFNRDNAPPPESGRAPSGPGKIDTFLRLIFGWFFHGLGIVFARFLGGFFTLKFYKSLEGEFVKKLTKPRPWRQNQGSTFLKLKKKKLKIMFFFGLRFWMYFSWIWDGFWGQK